MPEIVIIAAVARNGVIGKDNQLLWNIPEDMAHFKALTQGHTVLMGRKTWESLPPRFRPLPGRRNIVISRQSDYFAPGAELANSLQAGIALAKDDETVFVIGGAEIYQQAMQLADRLELTEVELSPEGDVSFPELSPEIWLKTSRNDPVSKNAWGRFVTYHATRTKPLSGKR